MDETFHESRHLSREALKELMKKEDGPGLLRFSLQYVLFLSSGSVLLLNPVFPGALWLKLVAGAIYALMVLPMFAVVHESGHQTAFASRGLNQLVLWLAGLPLFYTPSGFREFHFAHHRYTHDPHRDPEISMGGRAVPAITRSLGPYLFFYTGLPLMLLKFVLVAAAAIGTESVWDHLLTYVTPRARRRVCWEGRAAMLLFYLPVFAAAVFLPGLFSILAATLLGHALLATCLIPEHNGLPHQGTILERTRSTQTNALLRWLMWNMPYHAEHHAYPAVPFHALPRLQQQLLPDLQHLSPGYGHFHRRVLASLLKGRSFEDVAGVTETE